MRDYFKYLPRSGTKFSWGVTVTGSGFSHIQKGSDYPPRLARHPADHMFTWTRGRTLDTWQAILIHEGSGIFESQPTGRRVIKAGSVFFLFPGVWHRYAPDPETGWVESWIEFEGEIPDKLRQAGKLNPRRAIFPLGEQPDLTDMFDRCHSFAKNPPVEQGALLATTALQILAIILSISQTPSDTTPRKQEMIRHAQNLMMEYCDQPLTMRELAKKVNAGYTYFRRSFREHTGLSPKQYLLALRLRRVKSLLANSAMTVKEIADHMGYSSPYHLSADFTRHAGVSPTNWRRRRPR